MDYQMITSAITSVGFPIVACCGMFYYNVKVVSKMVEIVKNNTSAIERLAEKL